jgi:hypothetical protein
MLVLNPQPHRPQLVLLKGALIHFVDFSTVRSVDNLSQLCDARARVVVPQGNLSFATSRLYPSGFGCNVSLTVTQ